MSEQHKFQFKTNQFDIVGGETRQFSGVAYSGDVLQHSAWGNVIFDLSTTKSEQKIPMLIEHDRDKRVGFTDSVEISNDIRVKGKLLSNSHAQSLVSDADEGFPWQQSVHIEPSHIRELTRGESETINGRMVNGPATIFENSVIREISFTPTGVDANTPTQIFSLNNNTGNDMPDKTNKDDIEALKEQINSLKSSLELAENKAKEAETDLQEHLKTQRQFSISELEKSLNKTFSDEEKAVLFSLDDKAFSLFSEQLKQVAKKLPEQLFSSDYDDNQFKTSNENIMLSVAKSRAQGAK